MFTNFGNRKSLDKRGGIIKIFRRSFFGLSLPKISVGELSTAALI